MACEHHQACWQQALDALRLMLPQLGVEQALCACRWAGDVNRTALMDNSVLKRDPFLLLGKLQLVTDMFARHGIKVRVLRVSMLQGRDPVAARLNSNRCSLRR